MNGNIKIVSTPNTLNAALEIWFVQNNIFAGAPYSFNISPNEFGNLPVVYLELGEINIDLIRNIKSLGNKIILYHMGAESLDCDISGYVECDLVIRNYYFPSICSENSFNRDVLWTPNGFRTGVGPRDSGSLKPALQRQSLASFLGWLSNPSAYKNERADFADAAKLCGENLYMMPSNGFSAGYNVSLYSAIMEDSIFAPCPAGNNPETIRLYDALELGCIPISLNHDYLISKDALGMFGAIPFPVLGSWAELPSFLEEMRLKLNTNPFEIAELHWRCIDWWSEFKDRIQNKIREKIKSI